MMDAGAFTRMQKEYETKMQEKMELLSSSTCWPVDWFPEEVNLENAEGTSLIALHNHTFNPLAGVGGTTPEIGAEVTPIDVLVFCDKSDFCDGIIANCPRPINILNKQTKAPGQMKQKDIENLTTLHPWDVVIFGYGIDLPATNGVEDIHKTQFDTVKCFLWMLQAIAKGPIGPKHVAVITVDTFAEEREIHEECGIGLVTHSVLFGMCNTARQEIEPPIQYIDTEWSLAPENMAKLASEVFRWGTFGQNNVRIMNKGRYVQRQVYSKPYELANGAKLILPESGHILITGGNGALGLVMGGWLLDTAEKQGGTLNFTIKFLSRSMSISDQNAPMWEDIQKRAAKLGITVVQEKADCSEAEKTDKMIKDHTPNIKGIIHSAGILKDSMIMNQSEEKFNQVFDSKSRAAMYIHDALERFENPDLGFLWVFSSGATYGNMGQLNYSGSNAWLDGLCRHRIAMGKPAMAPQWGAWGDVGMAANLDDASRRRMANSPMPYFSNAEGLRGLEAGIRTGMPHFQVHKYNPPIMMGMISAEDMTVQQYTRHFSCEICPPFPSFNDKNIYGIFRPYHSEGQPISKGLIFSSLYPEHAKALEDDMD